MALETGRVYEKIGKIMEYLDAEGKTLETLPKPKIVLFYLPFDGLNSQS